MNKSVTKYRYNKEAVLYVERTASLLYYFEYVNRL